MSALAYLMLAIASEVIGTTALKASEGFTRVGESIVVAVGYIASFVLLSQALREMAVGTAYAIWSGLGTAAIAILGVLLFDEALTAWHIVGIGLIIAGVVILNLVGGAH